VTRWIGRSTVITLSTLAIAAAGVSFAQAACPPQDLVCLGGEAAGTGQGGLHDSIAPVTDAVDAVTGDVLDRVKDLLDGVWVDPPDPIGGGGGGTHHPPGQGSQGTSNQAPPHGGAANGRIPDGRGPHASSGSGQPPTEPAPSLVRGPATASGDRFDTVLEVARSLAIVLTLFGLAVGFVAIQDRFDRNDPRLALAPVESDIVEFG
jgi:hypothetical protein